MDASAYLRYTSFRPERPRPPSSARSPSGIYCGCVGLWARWLRVEEGGDKASRLLDPGLCIMFGLEAADLMQRIMRRPKIDGETAWLPINIEFISRSECIFFRHGISLDCEFSDNR